MKNYLVYPLMVLAISVSAWSGEVKPGHYTGKLISLRQEVNGSEWSAVVNVENGYKVAKVKKLDFNYYEIWRWNDQTLIQEEFDDSTTPTSTYGATNDGGKYRVNCKDRAKGDCDAGVDPSKYWIISATADGFTYEGWQMRNGDVTKIHTFNFKLVK